MEKEEKMIGSPSGSDEVKKLIAAFDRFIPYQMLDLLGKGGVDEIRLGDQVERKLTIMFADIRDFTTLSETRSWRSSPPAPTTR
jgi:adenylate cyclase